MAKFTLFVLFALLALELVFVDCKGKPERKKTKMSKKQYKLKKGEVEDAVKAGGQRWIVDTNPDFDELADSPADDEFMNLLGGQDEPDEKKRPKKQPKANRKKPHNRNKRGVVPETYDAREYTVCKSIDSIRYQYRCSSCWAVTSASAMSDRHCIYNYLTQGQKYISDYQIISCIPKGCAGGKEWDAFDYWVKNGLVTGGTAYPLANQPTGCLPMPYGINATPTACPTTCSTPTYLYNKTFQEDKTFGGDWYTMWSPSIAEIKNEIYNYGPVTAFFTAYEDLFYYKGGLYEYAYGDIVGYHVTKLIGWGKLNGTEYWQAVNTWGVNWGEKGLFKIPMGVNEVGIEERIHGFLPKEAFQ
jgi:cathepsin B